MKIKILKILLVNLLLLPMLVMITTTVYGTELRGYEIAAENQYLQLFINKDTTEIAVMDKSTTEIWYSNPPGSSQDNEQLEISYFDPGDEMKKMNNFKDSIEHGQFEILEIENGVQINYTLGEKWNDDDYIPIMISKERFEKEIIEGLEQEKDREFLRSQYELVSLVKLEEGQERLDIPGVDKDIIFQDYQLISPGQDLSSSNRASLINNLIDRVMGAEMVITGGTVTSRDELEFEFISQLVDNPTYVLKSRILPWDRGDLIKFIKQSGYTPEDVTQDHWENYLTIPERNVETFNLTIKYRLDHDSLLVRIPMDKLKYPKDVLTSTSYMRGVELDTGRAGEIERLFGRIGGREEVTFPLHSITVLPYFGAVSENQPGYIFVPDGSGALIDIEQATNLSYSQAVYNIDYSVNTQTGLLKDQILREPTLLPVYGLKDGNKAFFAIIEEGSSFARINARVSGRVARYNRVYTEYILVASDSISLTTTARSQRGGGQSINIYQQRLPEEDIEIRYRFLHGEESNYVGMARAYQEYLVEKYDLSKIEPAADIPFYLELIGAISRTESIMGIPRRISEPLTTFQQASKVVDEIKNTGINNIKLKYSGWLKYGIEHIFPKKVQFDNVLGKETDFSELQSYLHQQSIDFFPEVGFLNFYSGRSKGIDIMEEATLRLNGDLVVHQQETGNSSYFLSPGRLDLTVKNFLEDYTNHELTAIALRNVGEQLYSDFREDSFIDRGQAQNIITKQLKEMKVDNNLDILANRGNSYILPFVDHILDLPLEATNYRIVTKSVPFYQIVLHGYVNYAGLAINLAGNIEHTILKSIETGAYPYFKWSYNDSDVVNNTDFSYLYTLNYLAWLDEAQDFYREANEILKNLQDQRIINHRQVEENVYLTSYENGKSVIVNYNPDLIIFNGIRVEGEGFKLIKEGKNIENR